MRHIRRMSAYLVKYMIPGISTFLVDLAILWILTEEFEVHYLPAVALAFFVSTLLNFFAIRYWAFSNLKRKVYESYMYFSIFAFVGIISTSALMSLFIEVLHFGTISARVLTALVVGIWNFLTNYYINFKMHEHDDESGASLASDI